VPVIDAGLAFTLNDAELLHDTVVEHPALLIEVTMTLVEPVVVNLADGITKVPVDPDIVNVAVLPVDELLPDTL
jgi:hypothetical protein